MLSPKFVREELGDEPIAYLKKVKVPVLALVGSLDRTVPAGPYVAAMRPVLATIPGSRLQVLPQLNHVMQTAKTGLPKEFTQIEETIAPLAMQTIGDWILVSMNKIHSSNPRIIPPDQRNPDPSGQMTANCNSIDHLQT
jgi:hypothetical protein